MPNVIKKSLVAQIVLASLAILPFLPCVSYDFIGFDDNLYVYSITDQLEFTSSNIIHWLTRTHHGYYSPLLMLSFMLDYGIGGLDATGFHVQNLFWHAVTVIAVFHLFRHFKLNISSAFLLALIYAVHPQRVESVVWITERKDVLSGAFFWWSVVAYLKIPSKRVWLPAFTPFALFICSLGAKPMAVSLPFIFTLYGVHRRGDFNLKPVLRRLWPYFIVDVIFVFILLQGQRQGADRFELARQLYVIIHNLAWYPTTTFLPFGLCPMHPLVVLSFRRVTMIVCFMALASGLGLYAYGKSKRSFMFNILPLCLCYLFSLGPVIGFLPMRGVDYADRFNYIPSVFLLLGAGLLYHHSSQRWPTRFKTFHLNVVFAALALTCAVAFAWLSVAHARTWRTTKEFYERTAAATPANREALWQWGLFLLQFKDYGGVLDVAERLRQPKKIWRGRENYTSDQYASLYLNASVLFRLNRKKEAYALLDKLHDKMTFNELGPQVNLLSMLAGCHAAFGRRVEAMNCYEKIIGIVPENSFEYNFYSGVLASFRDNPAKAAAFFLKAHELRPNDEAAKRNLMKTQTRLNKSAKKSRN